MQIRKMEDHRMKSLKKSKSKFLSQLASNRLDRDPNASIDEKMQRLITQAELLASFLLNKYQTTRAEGKRPAMKILSKRNRVRGVVKQRTGT